MASASNETVTVVSDVATRSMEISWFAKHRNASARNPTCCHMPRVSMVTSTVSRLTEIAFTLGVPSSAKAQIMVPTC